MALDAPQPATINRDGVPVGRDDFDALRALMQRSVQAWGAGDAEAYAACFTEDADYVVFDGARLHGRAINAVMHHRAVEGPLKGSRLEAQLESVRFLSPGVALVHSRAQLVRRGRRRSGQMFRQTLVAVCRDGEWAYAAFQNTRIIDRPMWKAWLAWALNL